MTCNLKKLELPWWVKFQNNGWNCQRSTNGKEVTSAFMINMMQIFDCFGNYKKSSQHWSQEGYNRWARLSRPSLFLALLRKAWHERVSTMTWNGLSFSIWKLHCLAMKNPGKKGRKRGGVYSVRVAFSSHFQCTIKSVMDLVVVLGIHLN